jgi:hypothetical protein
MKGMQGTIYANGKRSCNKVKSNWVISFEPIHSQNNIAGEEGERGAGAQI